MRNLLLGYLLIFVSTFFLAQEKESGKAVIKTKILCDHFQGCETGSKNFKANMLKTKGVRMYTVDDKAMAISVYYNPQKQILKPSEWQSQKWVTMLMM